MGLDFHQSLKKPAGSKKCKSISKFAEKLRTSVKKQETQVVLSLVNEEEWAFLETYKKYAIGDRYYQMSINQGKNFLRRFNESNVSAIDTTNSHILPADLSISVLECGVLYPPIEILDEMFSSASNLFQDPPSIVQCPGPEGYLAKSKSDPNQPHHIKLNKNGSFACDASCTKFRS